MHRLTSSITAAAFLLHVLLGCCAHHAHAAEGVACTAGKIHAQAGVADSWHGHCHEHAAAESAGESPVLPADSHDDCEEADCSFLNSGKSLLMEFDSLVAALPALLVTLPHSQDVSLAKHWIGDTGDPAGLPVRLHLIHQVWLI